MTAPIDRVLVLRSASRWFETPSVRVTAVDDASFEIGSGEIVGLAGPSGSGKTTLLNLVAGWEVPDAGEVERRAGPATGWHSLAVVPQELGLLPELDAVQNVRLAGRLSAGAQRSVEELFEMLDLVGLSHRMPDELSMGEQQRVAVARAVLCTPRLLVADEPTAHQDERHADQVMSVLAHVASEGGAVLVATHDDRLLASVDRVIHVLDGRLVTPSVGG
jgi:putative ABC transport system ATP-binding protein